MRKKRIMLHQYKVIKTKASYIYLYENYIVSVGLLENAHYNLRVRIGYKLQPI